MCVSGHAPVLHNRQHLVDGALLDQIVTRDPSEGDPDVNRPFV